MPKVAFPDATDRQLLMLLQQDCRSSLQDMGSKVGLSTSAVNERVRKLYDEGVVTGWHARVNPKSLGLDIGLFLEVEIDNPENDAGFIAAVAKLPDVLECHHVTGEFAYLLKIRVRDTGHLERLLTTGIKSIAGVTRTRSMIVMSSPKNSPVLDCLPDRAEAAEGEEQ